jgi:hypothetical protein
MSNKAAWVFIAAFALVGCSQEPAKLVRNGKMSFDSSATVDAAIKAYPYFKQPVTWSEKADQYGKTVYEVKAEMDLKKVDEACLADPIYKQNRDKIAKLTCTNLFEKEGPDSFRFQNSFLEITNPQGQVVTKEDDTSEFLLNIYRKQFVRGCGWMFD